MLSALVYNGSIEDFYPVSVPDRIYFKQGGTVDGATVGYSNSNGYSILPASYADSPPQPWSYSTGNSYVISGGQVSVTRTWVTPAAPKPSSVQVQSASTPTLNGVYTIDPGSQSRITAVVVYAQANGGKFPGGGSSIGYYDINGVAHTFTSAAQFQAFATAIADYVAAIDSGLNPSTPLTIA